MAEDKRALGPAQVAEALAALPDWAFLGRALTRRFICASFAEITVLVRRLADTIESTGHHPDVVLCTTTRTLTVTTTTHSAGGVTQADVDFARALSG
ncbi:MAG: 4a-hydroxytetrahydrobiopterin dehydratase [Armatimonadetes bacterium]|nr:4a-hydroxytetrahydrobiopterin dehydratase [Armatimonadota bacterium]